MCSTMEVVRIKKIDKCVGIDFKGRYYVTRDGRVFSSLKDGYLKPFLDGRRGYLKVKVYIPNSDGRSLTLSVHRLVKLTYDNLPYHYDMTVDHLDNIKTNNHYDNLDLCSNKENVRRSIDRGSSPSRANQLSIKTVHEICKRLFVDEDSSRDISDELEVSIHAVRKIKQRKNYAYISELYI